MHIEETTAVDANGEAPERTFRIDLTETELDALRVPLGRIVGPPNNWVRKATTELYFAAGDALGYRDDVQAARHCIEVRERPRQPTDNRA
jgi:hypothetical protein